MYPTAIIRPGPAKARYFLQNGAFRGTFIEEYTSEREWDVLSLRQALFNFKFINVRND
jgi:hypothetical protein